jgi:hypothetical protein
MRFHLIHPSIVNLYIDTLTLHVLQENLGIIGPDGLTDEIQSDIDNVASSFMISVREAEQLFGSSDVVQDQLNVFSTSCGDA